LSESTPHQKQISGDIPLEWGNRPKLNSLAARFLSSEEGLVEVAVRPTDVSEPEIDFGVPKIQFERAGKLSTAVIRLFLPDGITEDRINSDALASYLTEKNFRIDCEMPALPTTSELKVKMKYEAF